MVAQRHRSPLPHFMIILAAVLSHEAADVTIEAQHFASPASTSLQFSILLGIALAVQGRWDQLLGGDLLAREVADDGRDGERSDLIGELDGVGVDQALLDRALAFGLAVEADELDLVGL